MPPITTDSIDPLVLPREVSEPIFERTRTASAIQGLVPQEPLSDSGRSIPIITGEPQAAWIGEGERKPVSDAAVGARTMDPRKLAVIVVYSTEVSRRNPAGLSTRMQERIGDAMGRSFDRAAISASAGPFSIGLDDGPVEVTVAGQDEPRMDRAVIDVMRQLASVDVGEWDVTGWVAHTTFRPELLDSRDTTGRPIYDPNGASGNVPALKGYPLAYGRGIRTADGTPVMIAGEWDQAAWGQVGNIEYAVSAEASLEVEDGQGGTRVLHTFQDNFTALRAETWFGFVVGDRRAFATLRMGTPA